MIVARRRFLALAAIGAPLAVLGVDAARAATCYDPAALPLSQKNRRRSLGYMETAGDAARRCQGCAFFTAGAEGCGTCALLAASVNAGASCGSFAARGK
jgi:hypothetical protein